jgi:hypothetical protein
VKPSKYTGNFLNCFRTRDWLVQHFFSFFFMKMDEFSLVPIDDHVMVMVLVL